MARYLFLILVSILPVICQSQVVQRYTREADKVSITLNEGTISIYPLRDRVVRIQYTQEEFAKLPELVFLPGNPLPEFSVSDLPSKIEVRTCALIDSIDKQTGKLTFSDTSGNLILSEQAGSRKLIPDTIMDESCYQAEQSFESPADEYIFGLRQFQDGLYNLKGVSRRLKQVN